MRSFVFHGLERVKRVLALFKPFVGLLVYEINCFLLLIGSNRRNSHDTLIKSEARISSLSPNETTSNVAVSALARTSKASRVGRQTCFLSTQMKLHPPTNNFHVYWRGSCASDFTSDNAACRRPTARRCCTVNCTYSLPSAPGESRSTLVINKELYFVLVGGRGRPWPFAPLGWNCQVRLRFQSL